MTTIGEKLEYLNETKALIRASINNKGGQLTAQDPFRLYPAAIDDLPANSIQNEYTAELINVSANGNITSKTTKLTLFFDKDVVTLNDAGIIINDPDISLSNLSRIASGIYEITVLGDFWTGEKTITVAASNVTIVNNVRKIMIYEFDNEINTISIVADGSGDNVSSTRIMLTFDEDIPGLTANDIKLSNTTITKTLYRLSLGKYILFVSGFTNQQESITITVTRLNYVINNNVANLILYKYQTILVAFSSLSYSQGKITAVFDKEINLTSDNIYISGSQVYTIKNLQTADNKTYTFEFLKAPPKPEYVYVFISSSQYLIGSNNKQIYINTYYITPVITPVCVGSSVIAIKMQDSTDKSLYFNNVNYFELLDADNNSISFTVSSKSTAEEIVTFISISKLSPKYTLKLKNYSSYVFSINEVEILSNIKISVSSPGINANQFIYNVDDFKNALNDNTGIVDYYIVNNLLFKESLTMNVNKTIKFHPFEQDIAFVNATNQRLTISFNAGSVYFGTTTDIYKFHSITPANTFSVEIYIYSASAYFENYECSDNMFTPAGDNAPIRAYNASVLINNLTVHDCQFHAGYVIYNQTNNNPVTINSCKITDCKRTYYNTIFYGSVKINSLLQIKNIATEQQNYVNNGIIIFGDKCLIDIELPLGSIYDSNSDKYANLRFEGSIVISQSKQILVSVQGNNYVVGENIVETGPIDLSFLKLNDNDLGFYLTNGIICNDAAELELTRPENIRFLALKTLLESGTTPIIVDLDDDVYFVTKSLTANRDVTFISHEHTEFRHLKYCANIGFRFNKKIKIQGNQLKFTAIAGLRHQFQVSTENQIDNCHFKNYSNAIFSYCKMNNCTIDNSACFYDNTVFNNCQFVNISIQAAGNWNGIIFNNSTITNSSLISANVLSAIRFNNCTFNQFIGTLQGSDLINCTFIDSKITIQDKSVTVKNSNSINSTIQYSPATVFFFNDWHQNSIFDGMLIIDSTVPQNTTINIKRSSYSKGTAVLFFDNVLRSDYNIVFENQDWTCDDTGRLILKADNIPNSIEYYEVSTYAELLNALNQVNSATFLKINVLADILFTGVWSQSFNNNIIVELYSENNSSLIWGPSNFMIHFGSYSYGIMYTHDLKILRSVSSSSYALYSSGAAIYRNIDLSTDPFTTPCTIYHQQSNGIAVKYENCKFKLYGGRLCTSWYSAQIKVNNCEFIGDGTLDTSGVVSRYFYKNCDLKGKINIENALEIQNLTNTSIVTLVYTDYLGLSDEYVIDGIEASQINLSLTRNGDLYKIYIKNISQNINLLYYDKFLGHTIFKNLTKAVWEKIKITDSAGNIRSGWYISHDGKYTNVDPGPWN